MVSFSRVGGLASGWSKEPKVIANASSVGLVMAWKSCWMPELIGVFGLMVDLVVA